MRVQETVEKEEKCFKKSGRTKEVVGKKNRFTQKKVSKQ